MTAVARRHWRRGGAWHGRHEVSTLLATGPDVLDPYQTAGAIAVYVSDATNLAIAISGFFGR